MRKISFRGKTISGEWAKGLLTNANPKTGKPKSDDWYVSNSNGRPFAYQVRPETLGQFTGLLDKNGKEIFEGDIYTTTGGYSQEFVVYFKNAAFCGRRIASPDADGSPLGFEADADDVSESYWYSDHLEVVGNIHETQTA